MGPKSPGDTRFPAIVGTRELAGELTSLREERRVLIALLRAFYDEMERGYVHERMVETMRKAREVLDNEDTKVGG